jgi:predicted amidophosphoribosyltransferase
MHDGRPRPRPSTTCPIHPEPPNTTPPLAPGGSNASPGALATPHPNPPETPSGHDAPASPTRLVWPPKPLADTDLRPARPHWHRAGDVPPQLAVAEDDAPVSHPDPRQSEKPWWYQVEEHWLGLTSQGFVERARDQGWAPDLPDAYCPRCGTRVGLYEVALPEAADFGLHGCPACDRRRLPWSRCVRLGDYHGLLRRAVHEFKFRRWRPVGRELGMLLGSALAQALRDADIPPACARLIPVSPPFWRRLWRGIDHTQVLARAASETSGVPMLAAFGRLFRPSQLAVAPTDRRRNVKGSFRVRRRRPAGVRVAIVLDDVRTTGATMLEACRTLRTAWPGDDLEIWSAVVGVASKRRRPLAWSETGDGGDAAS